MVAFLFGVASAFWLGVLTSISPCPLATNIAAISFIGKRVSNPRYVVWTGVLYTVGRMLAYVVVAALLVGSLLSRPTVSHLLQKYMNRLLGPILILVGMFLLELLRLNLSGRGVSEGVQKRAETWGLWGSLLLGVVFALSFCPISAALFFGSLFTLALKHESPFLLPSAYGLGTGLPVFVFAGLVATGAKSIGTVFNKLTAFEWWARRITGSIFILVGVYYCLVFIFGVMS